MRVIDIIGKRFGKYKVDYFQVNLNGEVDVSYYEHPVHYQELLKEMKAAGEELPKGPHAFDPNEYIGYDAGGLKILANMDENSDGKYNYKGPEPTIQVDPELYQNSITFDLVEPWVEIPKGEMIWCECDHCKSILHLPVEIVFDRYRYSYKCELCDDYDQILTEAKIYNLRIDFHYNNIELCRMVKTDDGIRLKCKCHICNREMLVTKEDYYRMRSENKCDECKKEEEKKAIDSQYRDALYNFGGCATNRKCLSKYFKNIKAVIINKNYTDFNMNNIEITMTCKKCGNTFSITGDKLDTLASYGKIDRCPDCAAKEYDEIDSHIGETCFKLTFLGKVKHTSRKNPKVICKCKCGNKIIIPYSDYKTGKYRSCYQCPTLKVHRSYNLPKLYKEKKKG